MNFPMRGKSAGGGAGIHEEERAALPQAADRGGDSPAALHPGKTLDFC